VTAPRRRATGTLVAIKAIRGRYLDDAEALKRFAREARTVADLDHPNFVRSTCPEQIDGRRVDGRSDIYSLGVLGWELLTGRRPWAGASLYSVIYKQKHEDLPRITSLGPRVSANLLFAIEGALAKNPAYRWQSAEQFLEHLPSVPGSIPYWAEPLAECFATLSAARAAELEEALRRVRGQAR